MPNEYNPTDVRSLWTLIATIRDKAPLIHNITNFVVMNNTANALLAIGASPAMIHSVDEVEDFVGISQALIVNIGTLDSELIAACKLAAVRSYQPVRCPYASRAGTPWR